ncbi:MAG: recombinase family protein [Chloroflexi bacterium]|nr:recombinase family protein [Chloroflexota bacterium]
MSTKAALWLRISSGAQDTENQRLALEAFAARRGWEIAQVCQVQESAWKGAQQKALSQLYQDARLRCFQVLLTWALDRLSREGPQASLEIVNRFSKAGVQAISLQEPWTEVGGGEC